jgi:predicted alpha/beta-hydrolase family hydrolase
MADIETPAGRVSSIVDGDPTGTVVVLAPGAGADMRAEFMDVFAKGLAGRGMCVVRFNFAYAEQGRKSPDRQPVLEDTYRAVVDHIRATMGPKKLVTGGKSMGGRIASHIAGSGTDVDGLVFLGYPLHPPGKPERIRDAHLYDITAPMLFVEGTRDPFCPLETLERVRAKLTAPNDLYVVEGGDHSLKVRKSSGRSTAAAWEETIEAASEWVKAVPRRR